MATKEERARDQWPAHIDLPTNNWIFTQEQIDNSPSLRDDRERRWLNRLTNFIGSIQMPAEVHFLANVYLRRYFQRCFFMGNKRDYYTATTCVFLAARTLEMHIGLDKLIKRAVDKSQGQASKSKHNKEFYEWKDGALKSEMVTMEKLCCDFILFDPYEEFTVNYAAPCEKNPSENAAHDREAANFWNWMSPKEAHGVFSVFSYRLKKWAALDVFLLYSLEETSIALLIYSVGSCSLVFPSDYFKVRRMKLSSQKFKALIDQFYKIPSSNHPERHLVYASLRNCPEILDDNHIFENDELDQDNRSGAMNANEGNGLQSTHETSTQDQDFTSSATATSQTPDPERVKSEYGQIDPLRDYHTPSTQPQLLNTTTTTTAASTTTTTATTAPAITYELTSAPNNSTPYQLTTEVPKSNHFSGPSASTTPSHISMLKTSAPLIPMGPKKVLKKEETPVPPLPKESTDKNDKNVTDDGQLSSSAAAITGATTTTTLSSLSTATTATGLELTRSKRSKKIESPLALEEAESPKKAPRLNVRSTPQNTAGPSSAASPSSGTTSKASLKSAAKTAATPQPKARTTTPKQKASTATFRQKTATKISALPSISRPKSVDDPQKAPRRRQSAKAAESEAVSMYAHTNKKSKSMSSPVAKPKTAPKKRRSASDPALRPALSKQQLRRAEELFALVEDGDLSDVETVIKPSGLS